MLVPALVVAGVRSEPAPSGTPGTARTLDTTD